jgi:dihydrofolate reductase
MRTVVVSTTLRRADYPEVTIISGNVEQAVQALREGARRDVWLFGGAELFGRLLAVGLVDGVEVAVEPVLLGDGVSLLPTTPRRQVLRLIGHRVSRVGVVRLEYAVGDLAA